MNLKDITALQWVGIIILFNTTLIGGAGQLGDLSLSAHAVKAILAIATLGNGFLGGLVTMFGGAAAQVRTVAALPGVERVAINAQANAAVAAVAVDPNQSKVGATTPDVRKVLTDTAKGMLLVAFVLPVLVLMLQPAAAQAPHPAARQAAPAGPVFTGDLPTDIKNGFKGDPATGVQLTGNLKKDAQQVWDKIVAASDKDLEYASQLAANANTPSSKVRKQCWDAILATNQQANGLNLKDSAGNLVPQPDPKLFTQIEQAAEVLDALSPQGTLFTSCAGAAQLAQASTLQFINAAVTGIAGIAKLAPIPGL